MMKTKSYGIIVAVVTVALFMSGCGRHEHTIQTLNYTDDYPILYESELNQIFDDYTLSERKEIHIEGEECDCGYHRDTVNYYEWNITYTDSCGQTIECRLNNSESIYHQQYEWLEDQVETYFYDNYMMKYFGELMNNEAGSYCFCSLGDFCRSYSYSDEVEFSHLKTGKKYRESLENSNQLIPLSELSYVDIFDSYPIELCIHVRLNDRSIEENEWSENYLNAVKILEDMTSQIAEDIGNNLNLDASVYSDVDTFEPEIRSTDINYLRGEKTECGGFDFDHVVFKSYEGVYW